MGIPTLEANKDLAGLLRQHQYNPKGIKTPKVKGCIISIFMITLLTILSQDGNVYQPI